MIGHLEIRLYINAQSVRQQNLMWSVVKMGERGQIQVGKVYLYTHWRGDQLREILTAAIGRKERWNDEEYLTRIIFSEMVKNELMDATGYGIGSIEHFDLNYPLMVVDIKEQVVHEIGDGSATMWTFEEFAEGRVKSA